MISRTGETPTKYNNIQNISNEQYVSDEQYRSIEPIQAPANQVTESQLRPMLETPSTIIRLDQAITDKRALQQLIIRRSGEGIQLVSALKSCAEKASVTDCRQEQKAPLKIQKFNGIMRNLAAQGIAFKLREDHQETANTEQTQGKKFQGTLTYYGCAATFNNHLSKTKIRMRVRFYINGTINSQTNQMEQVRRSTQTATGGFVEIKIKNPRASDTGFVDKYRLTLPDRLISKLINLDPKSIHFDQEMNHLKNQVLSLNNERCTNNQLRTYTNDHKKIELVFATIQNLAKRHEGFIKPHLAISYARTGYKYNENYPLPLRKPHKPSWRSSFTPRTTAPIQYQMTVDKNITAHLPLLPLNSQSPMPVVEHFDPKYETALYHYPQDICVVEFKTPKPMALYPRAAQSKTHQMINSILIQSMREHLAWGTFETQTGKYGTIRAQLLQTFPSENSHQ